MLLYDPKDAFSLLNPYSAPNVLFETQRGLAEQNARMVREAAEFVAQAKAAERAPAQAAVVSPAPASRAIAERRRAPRSAHQRSEERLRLLPLVRFLAFAALPALIALISMFLS